MRVDTKEVDKLFSRLGKDSTQAIQRAINRTLRGAATETVRIISKDIGIKQKDVRTKVKQSRARNGSGTAHLTISSKRVPIIKLMSNLQKVRQISRRPRIGVSYRTKGSRKTIPGSFIQEVGKHGHVGVFKRSGKKRLPISEKFLVSVPHVFEKRFEEIDSKVSQRLNKNLTREIGRLIKDGR